MGKIIFYEDRNFSGRHHECVGDCAELGSYFTCCNSIRVENGCFVIYERHNYTGHQYFLTPGQYSDYQCWMGTSDSVFSCHLVPVVQEAHHICLYERTEYGGHMMELTLDCPNILDEFHINNIFSCNVLGGNWLFYDHPNYRGRLYYLRPGNYRRFSDWGGSSAQIGSVRRIMGEVTKACSSSTACTDIVD